MSRRRATLAAVALAGFACALAAAPASAGPGDLDPSFGTGGELRAPFGDAARDLLLLPGGRFLVAGGQRCRDGTCAGFTLARFEARGEPDETFASSGRVFTPIVGVAGASAVARQPDGKLVVAGDAGGQDAWALARYNQNGTLDSTFGSGGVTVTERAENDVFAADVLVTAGGKIVAAGTLHGTLALARYNPDGSLDDSFGNGGTVLTPQAGVFARALIELPDGRLVVAGGTAGPGLYGETLHDSLVRYTADGSLDESFGSQGTSLGLPGSPEALVRQPDGKLVTAGSAGLARYNADGSIDQSFAREPVVESVNDVVLQPDGKLVSVGTWITLHATSWVVRRFNSSGVADPGFCVSSAFPSGEAHAVALQPNGRLLVAGVAPTSRSGFTIRRYLGDHTGPCADVTAPVALLRIPRQRLGRVLAGGLGVAILSSERGTAIVRLVLTRKEARRVGLARGKTIGRVSHAVTREATTRVRVPLTRVAKTRLQHVRRLSPSVRLAIADPSGNITRLRRQLTLRR